MPFSFPVAPIQDTGCKSSKPCSREGARVEGQVTAVAQSTSSAAYQVCDLGENTNILGPPGSIYLKGRGQIQWFLCFLFYLNMIPLFSEMDRNHWTAFYIFQSHDGEINPEVLAWEIERRLILP